MAKASILVAEDEKFLLRVYKDKLTREGYDVDLASNGQEAMEKLKTKNYDLLLLDLIMPQKNGFEVLEEMRADPTLKRIPVLVLSNLGQDADVAKARELGIDDYLVKTDLPINEVMQKIKVALKKRKK